MSMMRNFTIEHSEVLSWYFFGTGVLTALFLSFLLLVALVYVVRLAVTAVAELVTYVAHLYCQSGAFVQLLLVLVVFYLVGKAILASWKKRA